MFMSPDPLSGYSSRFGSLTINIVISQSLPIFTLFNVIFKGYYINSETTSEEIMNSLGGVYVGQ